MKTVAIPVVCASVKNSLGCSLDEDLGSVSDTGGLLGCAVRGHGLAVTGEFQGEFLLPFAFNVLHRKRDEHLKSFH